MLSPNAESMHVLLQGFVKVVKNKAYFKRYQVKFRRRRGEPLSCGNIPLNVKDYMLEGLNVQLCSFQRERLTSLPVSAWSSRIRTSTTPPSTV